MPDDQKPTNLPMLVMRQQYVDHPPTGGTIDPQVVWPLNQRDASDLTRIVQAFGRMPYGGGVVNMRTRTLNDIATNLEALADTLALVAIENDRIKTEHTALVYQRRAVRDFLGL